MATSITIPSYITLEIDNTGKNIYINNETDYNSFVYLCNNFIFNDYNKKIFHITKNLTFTGSNKPDPINKFYHVLDGHGFTISGITTSLQLTNVKDYGLIIKENYGTIRNIVLGGCSLNVEMGSPTEEESDLENDIIIEEPEIPEDEEAEPDTGSVVPSIYTCGFGLLVGKNCSTGIIKNCKILSTCSISGTLYEYYSPICGINECGNIFGCVNSGSITISENMIVGCIAGYSGSKNNIEITTHGKISNCYNIFANMSLNIDENVYFNSITPRCFGGICGVSDYFETIENCLQLTYIYDFPETNVPIGESHISPYDPETSSTYAGQILGYLETENSITSSEYNVLYCYYVYSGSLVNIGIGNPEIQNKTKHTSRKTWSNTGITNRDTYDRSYDFNNIWVMSDEFSNINISSTRRPMLLYEISISGYKDDIDWFDPNIYKHEIKTASQIASLKNIINLDEVKNSKNVYIFEQKNDISFNGKIFTHPIGTEDVPFKEIYNGNGYKISGLNISGFVNNENLELSNHASYREINNDIMRACSIFGYNFGIIENIWIYNAKINPDRSSSTTLVDINRGNILNCKISNSFIYNKIYRIGGLCNLNEEEGFISNCLNDIGTSDETFGNVYDPDTNQENPNNTIISHYIGGICCINKGKIYNSMNKCTINAKCNNVGGICSVNYGIISGCNEPRHFYDVDNHIAEEYEDFIFSKETELNSYNISTPGDNVGGICGVNYGKINLCSNYYGYIGAGRFCGGISGLNYFQYSSETNSINLNGSISECKNLGKLHPISRDSSSPLSYYRPTLNDCHIFINELNINDTSVFGRSSYGGICGLSFNSLIKNCYNLVQLFETDDTEADEAMFIGGIVGKLSGIMENCYNIGDTPESYGTYCGGLVGYIENYSTTQSNENDISNTSIMFTNIKNCLNYNSTDTGCIGGNYDNDESFDITGCATTISLSDMKDETTFTGWDFDSIWEMDPYNSVSNINYKYPKIKDSYDRLSDNFVPKINSYQSIGIKNKRFKSIHSKEIYADKLNANVNFGKFYIEPGDIIIFDGGIPSDF